MSPLTPPPSTHLDIDRDSVGRDLAALVLTVVELLRQLMERQAIRRIDAGASPTARSSASAPR